MFKIVSVVHSVNVDRAKSFNAFKPYGVPVFVLPHAHELRTGYPGFAWKMAE